MDAAETLATLVCRKRNDPAAPSPLLVGIAGPVAVGKSVLARSLAAKLEAVGCRVDVVATDGFLLPNATLLARGLEARKGFPESYDTARVRAFLDDLRAGHRDVRVPLYSHEHYDVLVGSEQVLQDPEVVIIEGVNALQAPIAGALDVAVYLDADERAVFEWYAERFSALRAGDLDAHPFYRQFVRLADDDLRNVARMVWVEVNRPNLRENIRPSRDRADLVVRKAPDHSVESVGPPVPR